MPSLLRRRSALDLLKKKQQAELEGEAAPTTDSPLSLQIPSAPVRPVSEHGYPRSRLSHEVQPEDVRGSQEEDREGRAKRFSMLKFRNLSESALTARAKEAERRSKETAPPLPTVPSIAPFVPAIVKTAPTMEQGEDLEAQETEDEALEMPSRPSLFKRSMSKSRIEKAAARIARKSTEEKRSEKTSKARKSTDEKRGEKKSSSLRWRKMQGRSTGLEELARLASAHIAAQTPPPSYGDDSNSALALPVPGPRMSESGVSEDSNASSDQIYGSTTTTTHTVSTHTTFFKLPRRNKNRNSLFPLPVKIPPPIGTPEPREVDGPVTPRAIDNSITETESTTPNAKPASPTELRRRHTESPTRLPRSLTNAPLPSQSLVFSEPGSLIRNNSELSRGSSASSPLRPPRLTMRDRASTASSLGRSSYDMGTPPPVGGSGRNSTSTTGRPSFAALLNISRFRQSSDPNSPRHGSPGARSKSNSFAISREALVVPEREEGDTPGKYLERLEAAVARSMIAGILSKSADPFAQAVLRSYTRRFAFFGEPIDMSLRKFLLEADLPKETQQVDRVIQAFADRYHECNPGIFMAPDQAYIIAFSLMMLHTDAFNKNNKRKMQKQDYIKNTSGQSVSNDILGCFYDNICYTPFVHYDEEVDINGERVLPFKPKTKKGKLKGAITDSASKKPTGPVDPYNLLVDQQLDVLRPAIKESISMDDPYNYRTAHTSFDPQYLQRAFTHTGVLQIISQRSRPTAYEGQFTNGEHPAVMETHMQPGIIDIKITKVGTLWRKAAKKKKARSPWQEWGAILTGSQLYLFKNAHWAKGLVHQFMAAQRHGHRRIPVVFKPPLQEFKPDALIKTDNSVALIDSTYTRHKNAFTFVRPGGLEEVLLADNESELNDWLALINYAAAFRAAGVRIRGMVGGAEEDPRSRDVRRLDSTQSARSAQTTDSGLSVQRGLLSPQLQRQVMAARRQIMVQKISEVSKEINETTKELDNMLRNARHLLVLAPLAPKTREDIIHAAAHADASIQWTRRDIWRLKCHKDILAMDVQQEGLSAAELEQLSEQRSGTSESTKRSRPSMLKRLTSKARSPPQSPTFSSSFDRPMTMSSYETYISNDIFRAPPESVAQDAQGGDWRIPPVQLDVLREEQQHRASITSTLISTSSQGRLSVSNGSTMSSVRNVGSVTSDDAVEETSRGRQSSIEDTPLATPLAKIVRTNTSPERKGVNVDGTPSTSPPDSKQKNGVRRSLQKTLRDPNHHANNMHRHRRGKESDSTIKSANGGEEAQEGTPGLKREQGRFILHGKQASVVQFGNDWQDDKLKLRQEVWRQASASPEQKEHVLRYSGSGGLSSWRSPPPSKGPIVLDLTQDPDESSDDGENEDYATPPGSAGGSPHMRAYAEAAEAFAQGPVGAEQALESEDEEGLELNAGTGSKKRETVIGPAGIPGGARKVDDKEMDNSEDDVEEINGKGKRTTVIGPRSSGVIGQEAQANGGAEEEEEDARSLEAAAVVA